VEEKRRHARVQIELPVTCTTSEGAAFGGIAKDLSLGGLFIECSEDLPFGTELTITIRLPGGHDESKIPGVVRWNKPGGIGVQFGLLGAKETHLLAELMRQGKPVE
jgi:type IV pilus assembly protein PilZ